MKTVYRRISIRLEENVALKLDKIKEKREAETGKVISVSELVREFTTIGMDNEEESEPSGKPIVPDKKKQVQKNIKKESNTVENLIIISVENKLNNLEHEISDMKEMLGNIITTVSYPKELERLDKMKDHLEFLVSCVDQK